MIIGKDCIGVSVGALILNDSGQVFLTKRSQQAKNEKGKWEAPGGAVEFGETREVAIKREIMEELGVEIDLVQVLCVTDEILEHDGQHWLPTSYVARFKDNQTPKIMEPEKCDEIGWFDLDNLPSPLSFITSTDIAAYKKLQAGR